MERTAVTYKCKLTWSVVNIVGDIFHFNLNQIFCNTISQVCVEIPFATLISEC